MAGRPAGVWITGSSISATGEAMDASGDESPRNGDAQHVSAGNSGKTRPRERSNPTNGHEQRYSDTNCAA